MKDARHQILEQVRWTVASLADEAVRIDSGWVFRSSSSKLVWMLNQLRFVEAVDFQRAVDLADEHMSSLPFRHVVIEDESSGPALELQFRAEGWSVESDLLMRLVGQPDGVVDESHLASLSEDQMQSIMRLWALEEHVGIQAERLDQLMDYNVRAGRLWNERSFGVLGDSGSPVAITKLRTRDRVAWIEDVYTIPASRGLGHARMLVTHATSLARALGSELTFIIADNDDWPKGLYQKIGFEPVGISRVFRLRLDP